MGNLLFVHGIGVRAAADRGEHPYAATCRAIRYELLFSDINWNLITCQWGDDLGAQLKENPASLPPGRDARLGVSVGPDDQTELWAVLLGDPTFELRALANMPNTQISLGGPAQDRPQWVKLQTALSQALPLSDDCRKLLDRFDLQTHFEHAVRHVRSEPATAPSLKNPQAPRALARAIVATAVRSAIDAGVPVPTAECIQALVAETEHTLQPSQLGGISDWARSTLLGWGTSFAERRRATLTAAASPIAGDVILYQARGERLRTRISELLANATEPVAVLAHSLGGVAAVETLFENASARARVRKLITVGSQSGFFFEIDALRTMGAGTSLPDDFPDWLNLWDPRDFLSFLVGPVFSGGRSRQDVRIESGLPFPASHSAYWRQRETWIAIKNFLGK